MALMGREGTAVQGDSMDSKEEDQIVTMKLRLPQSLADRINIFRHFNLIDTKSEAINALLEKALRIEEEGSDYWKKK